MTNIEATSRSDFAMEIVAKHLPIIPSIAQPEEIAAAICWMASRDAGNVNGSVLAVDG